MTQNPNPPEKIVCIDTCFQYRVSAGSPMNPKSGSGHLKLALYGLEKHPKGASRALQPFRKRTLQGHPYESKKQTRSP